MAKLKSVDNPKEGTIHLFEENVNTVEEVKKKYEEEFKQLHENYLKQIQELESKLNKAFEENKKEKEIYENMIKKIREERDQAQEDLKQRKGDIQGLKEKIFKLEDIELTKTKNAKKKAEENEKSRKELQEKLDISNKELDISVKELENLKPELETFKKALEKSRKSHQQSEKSKNEFEKKSIKLSNRTIRLKSKIQEHKDKLKACLESYQTCYRNSVNLRDSLSAKRQKYIDLKEITGNLIDELERMRIMREKDISSYSELRREYQKLSVSYKSLSEISKADTFYYNQLRLSYSTFKEKAQIQANNLYSEYEDVIEQNQRSFREFITETSKIPLLIVYRNQYR